jgi:hypothetical protein
MVQEIKNGNVTMNSKINPMGIVIKIKGRLTV